MNKELELNILCRYAGGEAGVIRYLDDPKKANEATQIMTEARTMKLKSGHDLNYIYKTILDGSYKLKLKPLSSITEEELVGLSNTSELWTFVKLDNDQPACTMQFLLLDDNNNPYTITEIIPMPAKAKEWLCKNGFDCDNLIPNGFAVPANKQ